MKIDREWMDYVDEPGQMYCRITHFSTDATLGVGWARKTKLVSVLNPNTYRKNTRSMALKCSNGVNRNWPLGNAHRILAGNYGPLIPTIKDAK